MVPSQGEAWFGYEADPPTAPRATGVPRSQERVLSVPGFAGVAYRCTSLIRISHRTATCP